MRRLFSCLKNDGLLMAFVFIMGGTRIRDRHERRTEEAVSSATGTDTGVCPGNRDFLSISGRGGVGEKRTLAGVKS